MTVKKRLFSYLKPLRASLIVAVIFALLFVIAQLSQPFLLGKALDASKDNNSELFNIYIFIALGLAVLGVISAYIFEVIVMNSAQRAIKKARDDIYQKINSIALKDFDNKYRGDLLLLEIRDMENFSAGLFAVFKTLIQGIFTVIITIIMMIMVNWILAAGVILLSPLSMLMARFVSKFSSKHYRKQNELQAHISSISLETLNNIDIVQSLNNEEEALKTFNKENDILQKENELEELRSKAAAAIEVNKRMELERQEKDFYRLQLSDIDLEEIKRIRSIEPYLRKKEPLNKVIWKVYYEKPYTDLIGRVIGNGKHTGIYKITNIENGMCYIGQAIDLAERWKQHIKRGIGADPPTQNKLYPIMQSLGVENFTFEVVEECDSSQLSDREKYWTDFYKAQEFGYSIRKG